MEAERVRTAESLKILLAGVIDYAGLFPPAGLAMKAAVENYARYRVSHHNWALGRFIVPVSRLGEFRQTLQDRWTGHGWRVSALAGAKLAEDLRRVEEFNTSSGETGPVIDTLEVKVASAADVRAISAAVQGPMTSYVEIPIGEDPAPWIAALAGSGARAKVRTGGLTEDAFPASEQLARFIVACAEAGVPFKATAGLHHPLRCVRPLTYDKGAPQGLMHGFLNVLLAAAFARNGMPPHEIVHVLETRGPETLHFYDDAIAWSGHRLSGEALRGGRGLAASFGSCSFEEPLDDLRALNLL